MPWTALLLLILILPLVGALFVLALGRLLPKRSDMLVAALPLFLMAVALIVLVPLVLSEADLPENISPPSPDRVQQAVPTARWVQPPRTLTLPAIVTTTATPTATATPSPTPPPSATPHPFSLVTIVVRNGTGETGLATRTSQRLAGQGFRVLPPEDDPEQGNRPVTLILDRGDHPQVRSALAEFLHVPVENVRVHVEEPSEGDIIVILGDDFATLASATPLPTPTLAGAPTATPNPYAGVTIIVRNGTVGRPGLASRVADRLRAQGFAVLDVQDDDRAGERPHTLIFDGGDHTVVREALIRLLGVNPDYVEIHSRLRSADIVVVLGDDFRE